MQSNHTRRAEAVTRALLVLLLAAPATVMGGPGPTPLSLDKTFLDGSAEPGGQVVLQFTLALELLEADPAAATAIAFTDDLDATLSGLAAIGLPQSDICGAGSSLSGTSLLTFSGGSLAPGEQCTFEVTLNVPAGAAFGSHLNTTSGVSATISGGPVTAGAASDTLDLVALSLAKSFLDDPVVAGQTVDLRFTLRNLDPTDAISAITFTDDLDAALSGLVATGLPAAACGGTISGTSLLTFTGGSLAAAEQCQFTVSLTVPLAAASGEYLNLTSAVSAVFDSSPLTAERARDSLVVVPALRLEKSFLDEPAPSPGAVTLQFTVTNEHPTETATGLSFTDDLGAVFAGLVATGLPQNDICGAGSSLTGPSTLILTGGVLAPESACTFSVTLVVPAGLAVGAIETNTTSLLQGLFGAVPVSGAAASDDLRIRVSVFSLSFSKSFDGPTGPGGQPVLTFTLENLGDAANGLAFSDDLEAFLPGLVATGLPQSDVCGAGSTLSGTSVIQLSNASLANGATCTFSVTLLMPDPVPPGSYVNVTSALQRFGLPVEDAAAASLTVLVNVVEIPALGTGGLVALGLLLWGVVRGRLRRRVS